MLVAAVALKLPLVHLLHFQAVVAVLLVLEALGRLALVETLTGQQMAALVAQDSAGRLGYSKPTFLHWEATAEMALTYHLLAAVAAAVVTEHQMQLVHM